MPVGDFNYMTNLDFDSSPVVILVSFVMFISCVVRTMVSRRNFNLPQNMFNIQLAIIFGVLMSYLPYLHSYVIIIKVPPQVLTNMYIIAYVINSIFILDYHVFIRAMYQEIAISVMTSIVTPLVFGTLKWYFHYPDWTLVQSFLIVQALVPTEPGYITTLLLDLANHKYLSTIIKAEALFTILPLYLYYYILICIRDEVMASWLDWAMFGFKFIMGSFVFGFVWGQINIRVILLFNHDNVHIVSTSICMAALGYLISEYICPVTGPISIFVMMIVFMNQKYRISRKADEWLLDTWKIISYVVETYTLIVAGIEVTLYAVQFFDSTTIFKVVTWYFLSMGFGVIKFIPIAWWMNNRPYPFNLSCMLVLSNSNIKGAHSLLYLLFLLSDSRYTEEFSSFLSPVLGLVFITQTINCTVMPVWLNALSLSDLTLARISNMKHCIHFLQNRKTCIIDILKTHRYLANANWVYVRAESEIAYPYDIEWDGNLEEQVEDKFIEYVVTCLDCNKDVPYGLSDDQIEELKLDANIKVQKAKKVALIRQYEMGFIDAKCLQMLTWRLETIIQSNAQYKPIILKDFQYINKFTTLLQKILTSLCRHPTDSNNPPKKHFQRFCHFLVAHVSYDIILYIITLANGIFSIINNDYTSEEFMLYYHYLVWFIYLLDFLFKTIALSQSWLIITGLPQYLNVNWNIFDFILLLLGIINMVILNRSSVFDWLCLYAFPSFRTIAVIRLFCIFRLFTNFYMVLLKLLENHTYKRICFGYECATALVTCADEILYTLPQIISSSIAISSIRTAILSEREKLIEVMEAIQRNYPRIPITMKTKQVISHAKVAMECTLKGLITGGVIDDLEYKMIYQQIIDKEKFLRKIKFLQLSSPQMMFKLIPWMNDDIVLMEYFIKEVKTFSYDTKDTIMENGYTAKGIYIIVTGVLQLSYKPTLTEMDGIIPIIDNLSTLELREPFNDYFVCGNCIGELAVLTGRAYNCSITASTPSLGYWLPTNVIKAGMLMRPNPVNGLEAKLWKHCCLNLAVALIMKLPTYQAFTREEVRNKLTPSFMPVLRAFKVFVYTDMINELILIEGVVYNYATGEKFNAPMVIPKDALKLLLDQRDITDERSAEVKLLIIPEGNFLPYDIIEGEEVLGELVSRPTSQCLLHGVVMKDPLTRFAPYGAFRPDVWTRTSKATEFRRRDDLTIINLDDTDDESKLASARVSSKRSTMRSSRSSRLNLNMSFDLSSTSSHSNLSKTSSHLDNPSLSGSSSSTLN